MRMSQLSKIKVETGIVTMITIASVVALTSCDHKRHVIGSVNTEFKLIGPDHKIVVES